MTTRPIKGGATAYPDHFDRGDWIGLAVFALPIIAATIHSIVGG